MTLVRVVNLQIESQSNSLQTEPQHSLHPFVKYGVVHGRASFCSLNETQEPPNGYHENTG